MEQDIFDVLVIGSGPSGSLVTAYILTQTNLKLRVCHISQNDLGANGKWVGTYCSWQEELQNSWLEEFMKSASERVGSADMFLHTWDKVHFIDAHGVCKSLSRSYAMLHQNNIVSKIVEILEDSMFENRVSVVLGKVESIHVHQQPYEHVIVSVRDASTNRATSIAAKYVVNASGHFSQSIQIYHRDQKLHFDHRTSFLRRRYQTFYGEKIYFSNHGICSACLMDWTQPLSSNSRSKDSAPISFAYILPMGPNYMFLEETVVVYNKPISYRLLKERLEARKRVLGFAKAPVVFTEKYSLPMGGHIQLHITDNLVNFGGCANMGHAATGYMFGYVVNQIPELVSCIIAKRCYNPGFRPFLLRNLNDMGAYIIVNASKDPLFMGAFFDAMFSTPYWYAFMTREIGVVSYVINMVYFVFCLGKKKSHYPINLLRSIGWYFYERTLFLLNGNAALVT